MFPSDESETIELFKLCTPSLRWSIVSLQTAFPDAVIGNGNGSQLVAEFEYRAKNFKAHKHDPTGCDLIICYNNDWPEAPVPVWEIKKPTLRHVKMINSITAGQIDKARNEVQDQVTKLRNATQFKIIELESKINHWENMYRIISSADVDNESDDINGYEEEKRTIASVMIPGGVLTTAFLAVAFFIESIDSMSPPQTRTIYSGFPLLLILFVLTSVYWTVWETLNQIIKLKEEKNEQA